MFWAGFLVGMITAFIVIGVGSLVAAINRTHSPDRELSEIWDKED